MWVKNLVAVVVERLTIVKFRGEILESIADTPQRNIKRI